MRWGDHRISRPLYGGDRKILYPFDRGHRKINETDFARFFRPPPPVVNETPLTGEFNVLWLVYRSLACPCLSLQYMHS